MLASLLSQETQASDLFRQQSGVDSAVGRYRVSGKGVVIAILDRGIEWQNPDFINPDGSTRIKWLLDMTGQDWCASGNPAAVEYSEKQINAALAGGPPVNSRDAVGHGTVTAGIAAGNGRSFDKIHMGVATEADLIIVKMTSEGAPEHGDQPAENPFNGCISQALDWLNRKIELVGEPAVALIDSGVQLFGPTDGSSVVSRKIDDLFGNRERRIFVLPSGDEGHLQTHAGGTYSNNTTTVNFSRSAADSTQLALWLKGPPASITVEFDDDHREPTARTDLSGEYDDPDRFHVSVYSPGQEFFPATSSGDDHFIKLEISGHVGTGRIILQGATAESGRFDAYSDPGHVTSFSDHLADGRLTDYASTKSAIIVGASVSANTWRDIDGQVQAYYPNEVPGQLWSGSADGPTRDGRRAIDIIAPGETIFAAYASQSYWATYRSALIQDGGGHYGRQGATSGAAPIAVGAVALMLQMKPNLTSEQVRDLLDATADSDDGTGSTPNYRWGYGRINVRAALDRLCTRYQSTFCKN